jgi:hypothetical protein
MIERLRFLGGKSIALIGSLSTRGTVNGKRISEAMKQRWAQWKRKSSPKRTLHAHAIAPSSNVVVFFFSPYCIGDAATISWDYKVEVTLRCSGANC